MRVTVQNFIGRLAVPILLAVVIGSIFAVPRAVAALELQGQPALAPVPQAVCALASRALTLLSRFWILVMRLPTASARV